MVVFRSRVAGPSATLVSCPVELVPLVIAPATESPFKVTVPEGLFTLVLVGPIETVPRLVVTEEICWETLPVLTCSFS